MKLISYVFQISGLKLTYEQGSERLSLELRDSATEVGVSFCIGVHFTGAFNIRRWKKISDNCLGVFRVFLLKTVKEFFTRKHESNIKA